MRARLFAFAISAFASSVCFGQDLIHAEFELVPPPHFLQTERFFLSGLGGWAPDQMAFQKDKDGHFRISLAYPKNQTMEFKVTLGDWSHVEVTDDMDDVPNHRYQCEDDCRITITPENFKIEPFHPRPRTTVGEIQYVHEVTFPALSNKRSIAIYLPPGYHQSGASYPVIYAADGQNIFDEATSSFGKEWQIDETLENLIRHREIKPAIVVGIYSTEDRSIEYLMNSQYVDFIVNTIKPMIDANYRTLPDRKHTFFIGSSYGGNLGLFLAWTHSEIFSRFALVSGDWSWEHSALLKFIKDSNPNFLPQKVWIDLGDKEGDDYANNIEPLGQLRDQLLQKGLPTEDVHYEVVPGAEHNEASWAQRTDRILKFLLNDRK